MSVSILADVRSAKRAKYGVCMGDSQTDVFGYYGVLGPFCWPEVFANALRAAGKDYGVANLGLGGDTSCGTLARVASVYYREVPDFAVLAIGVNDPAAARTVNGGGATTTVIPTTGGGANFASGWVVINGESRYVQTDAGTGGNIVLSQALSSAPANGVAITIDTQKNIEQWIVAVHAQGVDLSKIAIVSAPYLNWANGLGDTQTVPYAPYVPVRAAQSAAAVSQGVTFVNLWAFMDGMIRNGTDHGYGVEVQGSGSWHALPNNQHYNLRGHDYQAKCVYIAFASQV